MRVLVACEFSGRVRDAFIARGHDAVSCDLLPTESPGPHIQGDVLDVLTDGWDLMIAHPPCTYLAVSGNRWLGDPGRTLRRDAALWFVRQLLDAPIPRIALENPVGVISTYVRGADQVVHPWWFGHAERKATCLWLVGLPRLRPTYVRLGGLENRIHRLPPSRNRWKERSITYQGIADAMAQQWGQHG